MTKLCLALDVPATRALTFYEEVSTEIDMIKVGPVAFFDQPSLILELFNDVWLDVKLHDIPRTVAAAIKSLHRFTKGDLDYVTVHAAGGFEMMRAAVEATPIKIIAVTDLSSLPGDSYQSLGYLDAARRAGVWGIVSSDGPTLNQAAMMPEIKTFKPGVRLEGESYLGSDHARTWTPKQAAEKNIDYIVVGSPITESINPIETIRAFKRDMQQTA